MNSRTHIHSGREHIVEDLSPVEVWNELAADSNAALVDVRSRAEWSFVGIPDLSEIGRKVALVEWRYFPDLDINPSFAKDLTVRLDGAGANSLYFICRSGVRSREAAEYYCTLADEAGASVRCVNVSEGFEGDLNDIGQRGKLNGWKARGLAWRQS